MIYHGLAKATDENLTSENWEYILVCSILRLPYLIMGGLMLSRTFVTRWLLKNLGMCLAVLSWRCLMLTRGCD